MNPTRCPGELGALTVHLTLQFVSSLVCWVTFTLISCSMSAPLQEAWFNRCLDDSQVRAPLFSVSSQGDAIGQISGGPRVGASGNRFSVRAALVASALLLAPVLPLYSAAIRRTGLKEAR